MKKYIQPELKIVKVYVNHQILTASSVGIYQDEVEGSSALAPGLEFIDM